MAPSEDQDQFNLSRVNDLAPSLSNDKSYTDHLQNCTGMTDVFVNDSLENSSRTPRIYTSVIGNVTFVPTSPVALTNSGYVTSTPNCENACFELGRNAAEGFGTVQSIDHEQLSLSSIIEELQRNVNTNSVDEKSNSEVQHDNTKNGDENISGTSTNSTRYEEENTVMIDVSNPIPLQQNSVVVIGGKKCVIQQNAESGEIVAYPIKLPEKPKKKRGRPKKMKPTSTEDAGEGDSQSRVSPPTGTDLSNSGVPEEDVIKGLVETSDGAGKIVRRSARKRQKTRELNDYESRMLESDSTSNEDMNSDYEQFKGSPFKRGRGRGRGRRGSQKSRAQFAINENRGPGRPKRYELQEEQTQRVLLRLANGQGVTMQISLPAGSSAQTILQKVAELTNLPKEQFILAPTQVPTPVTITPRPQITTGSPSEKQEMNKASTGNQDGICAISDNSVECVGSELNTEMRLRSEISSDISRQEVSVDESVTPTNEGVQIRAASEYCETARSPVAETATMNSTSVVEMNCDEQKHEALVANENLQKEIQFRCNKCDHQTASFHEYRDHIAQSACNHRCKCCHHSTSDETALIEHYKTVHPSCICSFCNHTAVNPSALTRHMEEHDDESRRCAECGKIFKSRYVLQSHIKFIHRQSDILYECNICSKKFTRKADKERHIRTHNPTKPIKCDHCDYRCAEKSDLKKHILIHENPMLACEVCGKTFRHKKNLDLHVKRHNNQRDFKCEFCDYFGYTYTDVRMHVKRKHKINNQRDAQAINPLQVCGNNGFDELNLERETSSATETDSSNSALDHMSGVTVCNQQLEAMANTLVQMPDGTLVSVNELLANGQLIFTGEPTGDMTQPQTVDYGSEDIADENSVL